MNTATIATTTRRFVMNSRVVIPVGTSATVLRDLGSNGVIAETAKGQVFIAGPKHYTEGAKHE